MTQWRDEWLTNAANELITRVFIPAGFPDNLNSGVPLGQLTRYTTSWPTQRATSAKNRVVGQTFDPMYSADGHTEVFVSPHLGDSVSALGVLTHELAHIAVGIAENHGPAFKQAVKAVGLVSMNGGVIDANTPKPGSKLEREFEDIIAKLGPWPHAKVDYTSAVKKQGTRLLKCSCPDSDCPSNEAGKTGYTVRITLMWAKEGLPYCGICQERMVLDDPSVLEDEATDAEPEQEDATAPGD